MLMKVERSACAFIGAAGMSSVDRMLSMRSPPVFVPITGAYRYAVGSIPWSFAVPRIVSTNTGERADRVESVTDHRLREDVRRERVVDDTA